MELMKHKSYQPPRDRSPLSRSLAGILCSGILALACLIAGCTAIVDIPDQAQFEPLEALAELDEPIARLYLAPTRTLGSLTSHSWFTIKLPGADTFDRWEVSLYQEEPYGYVRQNFRAPDKYVGGGEIYVWAELVGAEALPVVEFISQESPDYPYYDRYTYAGPNCNTYVQWVLDQTGWDVELPPSSVGKEYARHLLPDATSAP